jgi:hypothetical protein
MKDQKIENYPVARSYTLMELTGWFGKWFHIPEGTQGIMIDASGNYKLFPPGKRPEIRPWARLTGKGIGVHLGYYPPGPFELPARINNVLCGDDELVDVTLNLFVKVIDPVHFFKRVVMPVGELLEFPDIGRDSLHDEVQKVIGQYARVDVIHNVPTSSLVNQIREKITGILNWMGLDLLDIPLLFFRQTEDRLMISDKLAEIESRMDNSAPTEMDTVQLEKITREMLPDSSDLRLVGNKSLKETMNNLKKLRRIENLPKRHWLLRSLNTPELDGMDNKTRITLRKIQSLQTNWIIFLLILGGAITYFLLKLDLNNSEIIAFLVGTWGTILSFILASLKKLVEKKESILLGGSRIADLEKSLLVSHEDRKEVDHLVRHQCGTELKRAFEIINELRSRVYRAGEVDLALALKGFELELEEKQTKIQSSNFCSPFYLSGLPISESEWKSILDQEEEVLSTAKNLILMVERIRSKDLDLKLADIEKVRQQVQLLEDRFYDRSRIN